MQRLWMVAVPWNSLRKQSDQLIQRLNELRCEVTVLITIMLGESCVVSLTC